MRSNKYKLSIIKITVIKTKPKKFIHFMSFYATNAREKYLTGTR